MKPALPRRESPMDASGVGQSLPTPTEHSPLVPSVLDLLVTVPRKGTDRTEHGWGSIRKAGESRPPPTQNRNLGSFVLTLKLDYWSRQGVSGEYSEK